MNDREFERFMGDLLRMLRLGRAQRREIRREIEAHVADALADLTSRGVPRDDALRQVLDDFGDATQLAARFSQLGKKRRWIMHGTAIAACVGFALVIGNFLAAPVSPPSASAAGLPGEPATRRDAAGVETAGADDKIRLALKKNVSEIAFDQTPLADVIEWLATATGVNVHVQWSALESANISRDRSVNLRLKNVTIERVLRLMLDEVRDGSALEYEVQDGVMLISTREALQRNLSARVYDVRDILQKIESTPRTASGESGDPVARSAPLLQAVANGLRQSHAGNGDAAGAPGAAAESDARVGSISELQNLLCDLIAPDTWVDNGGNGQMRELRGVLVVRQTESVHRELERLLSSLRDVLK